MLQLLMLCLVVVVGGVSMRFAWRYLAGAPNRATYLRWFSATIAATMAVVLSPNIIVMAAAWTMTSLTLHRLLTIDETRVAAQLAAHKKFLLSRVADVAVWSSVLMLTSVFATANRTEILTQAAALPALPVMAHVALALLAVGVILRSAQLPFHGWLIQVMDVPTPVSALLHAGIVNLGAFVLISLAPLGARAPFAQAMLLVSGTVTAVLAALVMRTRANVKGALAWSTAAQMGFVLVECGLGAYDLAMLHVVAHGLYKSHAFLRSGSLVSRQASVAPIGIGAASVRMMLGLATSAVGILLFWQAIPSTSPDMFALTLIACSSATLFALTPVNGWRSMLPLLVVGLGLPGLYALWHQLFGAIVPTTTLSQSPTVLAAGVMSAFVGLAAVTVATRVSPNSQGARWLYSHASCGFHLDEYFTRLTFKLWPPTRVRRRATFQGTPLEAVMQRAA